jgi:signal transduction histidine kinase
MIRLSVTWKLIGAFLLVAVTGLVVTIFLGRYLIVNEFNQFVNGQVQAQFVTTMADYYRANGSWQGVREGTRRSDLPVTPAIQPDPQGNPPPTFVFSLVDQKGVVLIPAGPFQIGDTLPPGEMARGVPINVNGKTVGMAIPTGAPVALNDREEHYLGITYSVLIYATGAAAIFALFLGVILSVSLTRPLRELTTVIHNMTPENLGHQVKIRSRDELGELAVAFNRLSADLARSNLLRRQMTADIAHELRSPLQIVAGYIESMQDGILEPTPERLGVIGAEVELLNHLVADLRLLTLADMGALSLNLQVITPQSLVKRVTSSYTHQMERDGIIFETHCADNIGAVRADEERLVQVLGNIVSNARRYTPAQGKIQIRARQTAEKIILSVQDSGQGIAAADLPFIFERFYRADKARVSEHGESGLGLAIAKAIVEAHSGTITVSSPGIGGGATFDITLPAFGAKSVD